MFSPARRPIKALGTTDQHSQVQLYREGPNDKIITFLEVERFNNKLTIPSSMKQVDTLEYLANSNFQTLINAKSSAPNTRCWKVSGRR